MNKRHIKRSLWSLDFSVRTSKNDNKHLGVKDRRTAWRTNGRLDGGTAWRIDGMTGYWLEWRKAWQTNRWHDGRTAWRSDLSLSVQLYMQSHISKWRSFRFRLSRVSDWFYIDWILIFVFFCVFRRNITKHVNSKHRVLCASDEFSDSICDRYC